MSSFNTSSGVRWRDFGASLRFLDFIVLALSIGAFVLITIMAWQGSGTGGELVVDTPEGSYIYGLDQDRVIEVSGPIGVSLIEIKNHKAHFLDSPCKDKLCVHMGEQVENGQWAACLPNRVFLRIESAEESEVDAQLY